MPQLSPQGDLCQWPMPQIFRSGSHRLSSSRPRCCSITPDSDASSSQWALTTTWCNCHTHSTHHSTTSMSSTTSQTLFLHVPQSCTTPSCATFKQIPSSTSTFAFYIFSQDSSNPHSFTVYTVAFHYTFTVPMCTASPSQTHLSQQHPTSTLSCHSF